MSKQCVIKNLNHDHRSLVSSPDLQVSGPWPWVSVNLIVITILANYYYELWHVLQCVTVIVKCDKKLLQRVFLQVL